MNQDQIELKLSAEPHQLSMSQRNNFKVSLSATNQGKETIDPQVHLAQLFVNDEQSIAWNLAVGNGIRENKWFALPPGETVSMSWSSLGEALFPAPGDYTLVLQYGGKKLDPIKVQVLA